MLQVFENKSSRKVREYLPESHHVTSAAFDVNVSHCWSILFSHVKHVLSGGTSIHPFLHGANLMFACFPRVKNGRYCRVLLYLPEMPFLSISDKVKRCLAARVRVPISVIPEVVGNFNCGLYIHMTYLIITEED